MVLTIFSISIFAIPVSSVTGNVLRVAKNDAANKFSDYDQNSWYADYVAKLTAAEGIAGYPDGTFRPQGTINRAEFTKILVAVIYGNQEIACPDCPYAWASGYVKKAEEVGILADGEFTADNLGEPILRKEIARMIIRTIQRMDEVIPTNANEYKSLIEDVDSIDPDYKSMVVAAYAVGIIAGYPDGTFGPEKTATRAEAATMIVRTFDENEREVPELEVTHAEINDFDSADRVDFGIEINILKSTNLQFQEAEEFLNKKVGTEITKQIIEYAKQKIDWREELPIKYWDWNNEQIQVISPAGNPLIGIRAW